MTRVDLKAGLLRNPGGYLKLFQHRESARSFKGGGVRFCIQFDGVRSQAHRFGNRAGVSIHKETYAASQRSQFGDDRLEAWAIVLRLPALIGSEGRWTVGHQGALSRTHFAHEGQIAAFEGIAFDVQFYSGVFVFQHARQIVNVLAADVPFVRAGMHGDTAGPGVEAHPGRAQDPRNVQVARVSQVRNLVHVDAQSSHSPNNRSGYSRATLFCETRPSVFWSFDCCVHVVPLSRAMHLEFYGAAGGVTGSLHRLSVNETDLLLDCGLFQGHREESNRLNRDLPDWTTRATNLVLSHAHLDHSGSIPTLVKRGFEGNVFCTPPTRDLCSVMLRDAAMIQEQDARYLNKKKKGSDDKVEPLYTIEDAQRSVARMISLPLHRELLVGSGATLSFFNSGHVLGSALVCLDLKEQGRKHRLVFTGDLGREELPLLETPEIVPDVDTLIMESTYGDRLHPNFDTIDDQLADIVNSTIERGGRVYIPTFALERAQEVLYALERLNEKGKVPRVPIFIDSPLAIAITEIYKLHPESLAEDVRKRILERNDPFSPPGMRYVSDIASSRALQESGEPCIVIAGSGMCEGGRILFHFQRGLALKKNSVVIVGFMAEHTLGRKLVEGYHKVRVYGEDVDVHAKIHILNGLSAHADQDDLIQFARAIAKAGNLRRVVLVHGEDKSREVLAEKLKEVGIQHVTLARRGEKLEL